MTSEPVADRNMDKADNVTVLCMKWGAKYGPEYVNRLYGMAMRHISRPTRVVCLTDNPKGIRSEVACHPLPELPLLDNSIERGWCKIGAFAPEVAELLDETVLYLDLDIVIVDSLDPLFDQPGSFLIIHDWYHKLARIGNSSVFRFHPRRSTEVFTQYCRDFERISKKHRNEQEYLTTYMADAGALGFWPRGWCVSFRRDCVPWWPWRLWQTTRKPEGSRILVFHGDPKPPDVLAEVPAGERAPYYAAPWLAEYWRE